MRQVTYGELKAGDEFESEEFGTCRVLSDGLAKNDEQVIYFPPTQKVKRLEAAKQ